MSYLIFYLWTDHGRLRSIDFVCRFCFLVTRYQDLFFFYFFEPQGKCLGSSKSHLWRNLSETKSPRVGKGSVRFKTNFFSILFRCCYINFQIDEILILFLNRDSAIETERNKKSSKVPWRSRGPMCQTLCGLSPLLEPFTRVPNLVKRVNGLPLLF